MSLPGHKSRLDSLFDQLKVAFSEEYARGSSDAIERIVGVAQIRMSDKTSPLARKVDEINTKKKRAPRGASRLLVEKALKDQQRTIKEIVAFAKTDVEKLVPYHTVRLELERGKKEKRYKNNNGKWSLLV
jgi:hypothetical protein